MDHITWVLYSVSVMYNFTFILYQFIFYKGTTGFLHWYGMQ